MNCVKTCALLLFSSLLILGQACGGDKAKRGEVKEEYREAHETAADYFEQERDSAVRKMEIQKARIDARLENARKEARDARGEAKRKADEQVDKLEQLSKRTGDKIEEARTATREKWIQAKENMKQAANEIEAEWDTLVNNRK